VIEQCPAEFFSLLLQNLADILGRFITVIGKEAKL
jgi:hypothetical protein